MIISCRRLEIRSFIDMYQRKVLPVPASVLNGGSNESSSSSALEQPIFFLTHLTSHDANKGALYLRTELQRDPESVRRLRLLLIAWKPCISYTNNYSISHVAGPVWQMAQVENKNTNGNIATTSRRWRNTTESVVA